MKTFVVVLILVAMCSGERCTIKVQRGSRGECVKVVQRKVGVTVDGIFGPNTQNAVRTFQRDNGLLVDGIVGPQTWNAIYGDVSVLGNQNLSELLESFGLNNGGSNGCGCNYDSASWYDSKGATAGARNLGEYLKRRYGSRYEIYNYRKVRGGSAPSLHGEGRAVDFYASGARLEQIATHLQSIACDNGIQEIIWNRKYWNRNGVTPYRGENPHTDHVHVAVNHCGARNFNL